ncbi:MAG TPA: hypothetical protein VGX03_29795 [Candidatus Binatia bacterium]|nr:hypothetical protein [Candidatus Binatia bacterium]
MRSRRRGQAVVLFSLASLCVLLATACTSSVKDTRHQVAPLPLPNPTSITVGPVSVAVGTQHWSRAASALEEAFFPVAVTVRNAGNQSLCGGVPTAALGDSAGTSVSAVFPEGVVTRLFGPLASLTPLSRPTVKAAAFAHQDVFLVRVHGSHGGSSGGIGHGSGGFQGGAPGPPHLGPSPRAFAPQPFSSPFRSPVSPLTPGSQGVPIGGMKGGRGLSGGITRPPHWGPPPRVFAPPPLSSPFYSPFSPFTPSPFSPFYSPFPPLFPYGFLPPDYGYGPSLPPNLLPREEQRPEIDQALVREILTTAFASRPLAPQEERSGFLFFPLPVPDVGSTVLTWEWYDCVTHELVAYLSVPIPVEKHA